MPIEDGEYVLSTAEQIEQELQTLAREDEYFGPNIDLTPNSTFSTLFSTISEVQTSVDEDIQDVYQSAFLETATGEDLDRVVAITGVQRREAQRATGYVIFSNQDPVSQNYTIPQGTRVDTASTNPTQYRTTETTRLGIVQGFEGVDVGTYYGGDTTSFQTQTTTTFDRDEAVNSTASGRIFVQDDSTRRGDTYFCYQQTEGGGVQFLVQNADDYYEVTADSGTLTLSLYEGGTQTQSDSVSVTFPANEWCSYRIETRVGYVEVTLLDSQSNELGTVILEDNTYFEGGHGFTASTSGVYFDLFTKQEVAALIEAIDGGADGNSGAETLVSLPTPPNGVDFVGNPEPIGDPQIVDVTNTPLQQGQNEETDEQLRSRVRSTLTEGGVATANAIVTTLVNEIDGVRSVSLFENKTDSTVDGLPPYSFECVVLGGNTQDIADTIFGDKAVTARDVGGVNGTEVTETVVAENGQQFTTRFSRPTEVSVSIDVTIITNDTYIGDTELKNMIVEYIGGQQTDGTDVIGLGTGEDVYIDEIENIIVGQNETGVIGIDDSNTTYTPTPTTDSNGLEVISIPDGDVPNINADDITITEVEQ